MLTLTPVKSMNQVFAQIEVVSGTCPFCGSEDSEHLSSCLFFHYLNKWKTAPNKNILWSNISYDPELLDMLYVIEALPLKNTEICYCCYCGNIASSTGKINHSHNCKINQLIINIENNLIGV